MEKLRMSQFNAIVAADNKKMLDSKGKKFCVFVLLVAVLLTYVASVDAKGGRFSRIFLRSHSSHSSHSGGRHRTRTFGHYYRSPSTKPNPSLLLIAVLLISTVSFNAARTLNSERAGTSRSLESRVHSLQFRRPLFQEAN